MLKMLLFTFLTIVFALNNFIAAQEAEDSPCDYDPDRVLNPCGSACDRTCDNVQDKSWNCTTCTLDEPSCSCKNGLVLNSAGYCVLPEDCSKTCPSREAYTNCGNNECQSTCENIYEIISCKPKKCISGCICIPGFVRDANGLCIDETRCNVSCNGDSNAFLGTSPCGYRRKCSNIHDEMMTCLNINNNDTKQCLCKNGYAEFNNTCVENCPTCANENESFLCRSCDDITCDNLERINQDCYNVPCREGCFCNRGFARNGTGHCIRTDKCPQKSCYGDPNAVFEQCNLKCFYNCQNQKLDNCYDCCKKLGICVCKPDYTFKNGTCQPNAPQLN